MNAYLESKKTEARENVDRTIETVIDMFGFSREVAIEKVKKACHTDYSESRIRLNGFSKFDSDSRVSALRDQVLLKHLMVKYADTL